jgi:hypothetical protein
VKKGMELKGLTDRTLELFGVMAPNQLRFTLLSTCGDLHCGSDLYE